MFSLKIHFLIAALGTGSMLPTLTAGEPRPDEVRPLMVGDAILGEGAYELLSTLSDRYGHRMIGTPEHAKSLDYLEDQLNALGIETRRQHFEYTGWVRGVDRVTLLGKTSERAIRCAAMGYSGATRKPVVGSVVYVSDEEIMKLDPEAIKDRILLVKPGIRIRSEQMKKLAATHGVKGALLINRVDGGQLLGRTASHAGVESPVPLFSITQEEGNWMKRKLEAGKPVKVRLETTSHSKPMTGSNLIARLPGKSGQRIILGGHFDSWDLGQGALDNGLGVAQIYEVARLLKKYSPSNEHTVEFVWFDAEEFGLWGSRHFAGAEAHSDVRVMVNLDMVGNPTGINAMGFDSLIPSLERYSKNLGAWAFERKLANKPWMGSDHHPFILKGIPAITYYAPIDPEQSRYYHDFADTLDKVDSTTLARASAIIALLIYDLANDTSSQIPHLDREGTATLFREAGLEKRMKEADSWPFGE